MQPDTILLALVNGCKVFACLQTPFLSHDPGHLCKTKEKKSNSLPAEMFHLQLFFLLPPVSSKFCSSVTNSVRLEASSCGFFPFCSTITTTKGIGFSQNSEGHRTHELCRAKMGISLEKKKKALKWSTLMAVLESIFVATKIFNNNTKIFNEGSLNLPRPATCSVLFCALYQQVYCMKLPKIQPLKLQMWAVITAFGRLIGESEEGGK